MDHYRSDDVPGPEAGPRPGESAGAGPGPAPGPAPGSSPGPAPGSSPGPAPGASPGPAPGSEAAATASLDGARDATSAAGEDRVHINVRAECSGCGWIGTKYNNFFDRKLAEADKNNHIDDHPRCYGKVNLVELD